MYKSYLMRTKSVKFIFVSLLFLVLLHITGFAQEHNTPYLFFPDIPGYKTLKCDFHMHTVISDGTVIPSYRVIEAWQDGLDVIALTDHLGRRPRIKIDEKGIAGLYRDAYALAKKMHIILIPGAELTKQMPVGHYNLLFIDSFGSIKDGNYMDVLEHARSQSAFVVWNHPGWKQIFRIPFWHQTQSELLKKGLINGIEGFNYKSHYPLTQGWARKKKLTLFASSDIHDSTKISFRHEEGKHRPITLVFAKDTTFLGIKNALLAGRTLAFIKDKLYGNDSLLESLFHASVKVNTQIPGQIVKNGKEEIIVTFTNNSCIHYKLKLKKGVKGIIAPGRITIKPGATIQVKMYNKHYKKGDIKKAVFRYQVKNMYCSFLKHSQVNIRIL